MKRGVKAASKADGGFPKLTLPLQPPYPPMEAKRSEKIPAGAGWQFEPKWDGFRVLAFRDGDTVVLQSKSGQPLGRYFPELVEALLAIPARSFVLDGEIVVPAGGRLSFDDLLLRLHPAESRVRKLAAESPARILVFDLLLEPLRGKPAGRDLTALPLEARREKLERFFEKLEDETFFTLSPATRDRATAAEWFEKWGAAGLDGIIAKRLGQPYRSGDREGMVKVKHFRTADCVVGGFRYSSSGRGSVGALLLGLYDERKRLVFVGHSSSFSDAERKKLKAVVEPLRGENPFEVRVPGGPSRWSTERSGEWEPLEPTLVCEVRYDYFSQQRFRHGTKFLRWRPDKKPSACTMDQVEFLPPEEWAAG